MTSIVKIRVITMSESCNRTTFNVELTTNEGYTMTPSGFETASDYTGGKGLSIEEARDRALTEAHQWADFLNLSVEPFIQDGVAHEPSFKLETYATRREQDAEDARRK